MGYFSWLTSDTNKSIPVCREDQFLKETVNGPIYLLCPNGDKLEEKDYHGFGVFGNKDVYELVALWNAPEECYDENGQLLDSSDLRYIGINLACYDKDNEKLKYPIKIVEDKNLSYEEVPPAKSCPYQGYFYDFGIFKE